MKNIFSKFFSTSSEDVDNPNIQFGKYSDRNKTKEQLENWNNSIDLYEKHKYLDSYEEFFKYLKAQNIENVIYSRESEQIKFKFFQGSKIVEGIITNTEISAAADVVKFDKLDVAVMRRLLKENYYLLHSKFSKTKDTFVLNHFSSVKNEPPTALYYALKEVANVADNFDDLLLEEFPLLKPVNTEHLESISDEEKTIKIKWLRKYISETLKAVKTISSKPFIGAVSFLLLNLTYKLYYLLAPEGSLLEYFHSIQNIFWKNDDFTDKEKNEKIIEKYKILLKQPDTEISKSLYKVKSTFPVVKPTHSFEIVDFIKKEIEKTHWYRENKHIKIHLSVCEYIISYSTYNYGMESILHDLFQILWKIINYKFYEELGFNDNFVRKNKIVSHIVEKKINKILNNYKETYKNLDFSTKRLRYATFQDFTTSFLYEIINCDFELKHEK